jgi:3-dehydroquinate dehydratase II
MKILVLNGPNLNLLGSRDNNHYGTLSLKKIEKKIQAEFPEIKFEFFQSNHEGELIDKVQNAGKTFSGLIINPGGYAHSSVALRDALAECRIPKVEVHLSHLVNRENFRQNLITASGCNGYISGFKEDGYLAAIYLVKKLSAKKKS